MKRCGNELEKNGRVPGFSLVEENQESPAATGVDRRASNKKEALGGCS
jgi:hypothetical protein